MERSLELRTIEALALTTLNRVVDGRWVDWAVEMLDAGYESSSLVRLAGEPQPFNAFEMDSLVRRVFEELHLPMPVDGKRAALALASVWVERFLSGEAPMGVTLQKLSHLYFEAVSMPELSVFYLMQEGLRDLQDCEYSTHLPELTSENAEPLVRQRCEEWIAQHKQ